MIRQGPQVGWVQRVFTTCVVFEGFVFETTLSGGIYLRLIPRGQMNFPGYVKNLKYFGRGISLHRFFRKGIFLHPKNLCFPYE